jgi:hypothetical protein
MALAKGRSSMLTGNTHNCSSRTSKSKSLFKIGPLSLHTRTALHFVAQLIGTEFKVTPLSAQLNDEQQPMLTRIECDGCAFGVV